MLVLTSNSKMRIWCCDFGGYVEEDGWTNDLCTILSQHKRLEQFLTFGDVCLVSLQLPSIVQGLPVTEKALCSFTVRKHAVIQNL